MYKKEEKKLNFLLDKLLLAYEAPEKIIQILPTAHDWVLFLWCDEERRYKYTKSSCL